MHVLASPYGRQFLFVCGVFLMAALILLAGSPAGAWAAEEGDPLVAAPAESDEPAVEEASAEEEAAPTAAGVLGDMDTLWTCIAAFLVFFMQAGFAMVECGFTRAKNACNIIMKNLMDFSLGTLLFWLVGFGLMFGTTWKGLIGTDNFLFDAGDNNFNWAFLIFQTVFCATAATIISGAMAERTKFISYLCYTVAITTVVYPVFGSWAWGSLLEGSGWLEGIGFADFAGSTVVHSIGGWAALAGAIVLGARLGKYKNGKVMPIPGHNIPMAALGVFILWLGWFGFNAGSTTAAGGGSFAYIAVTTNMAAAAGATMAMFASWIMFKKPDPSFALNGALAGLVGITAGCNAVPIAGAVAIGGVAGVLVVLSVLFFDRIRIDDPVGAVSVHGVCGAWGTLAVGLFASPVVATGSDLTGLLYGGGTSQLVAQLIGIGACFAWAFPVSFVVFYALKVTIGLRVSEQEEMEGLDVFEHGIAAYPPGFVADTVSGTSHSPLPRGFEMPSAAPAPIASPQG